MSRDFTTRMTVIRQAKLPCETKGSCHERHLRYRRTACYLFSCASTPLQVICTPFRRLLDARQAGEDNSSLLGVSASLSPLRFSGLGPVFLA